MPIQSRRRRTTRAMRLGWHPCNPTPQGNEEPANADYENILLDVDGAVATITLNAPGSSMRSARARGATSSKASVSYALATWCA